MRPLALVCVFVGMLLGCNAGGSGGTGGEFRLLQFLENNQSNIPRNRALTFRFSSPVADNQDFSERLRVQNVQAGPGSNFAKAIGVYVVNGDNVHFAPRLPNLTDRGDAGFHANASYVVFVKGGPDALRSASGAQISTPQEFSFVTNEYFEDPVPNQPPRALGFFAHDSTTGARTDLSRLDPRPGEVALIDNADLIAAGRYVEPGAGAAPAYAVPWEFELRVSEPVDPLTVTTSRIEMFEVFSNATTSGDVAPPAAGPGYFGDPVLFQVPVNVRVVQSLDGMGQIDARIIVTPVFTLVDNTRYRIRFAGTILGIDFREQFIGANGLTGDGQTVLAQAAGAYPEPGGLGYTSEFIVRDRPAIERTRTLTYDPLVDGIKPELGQTVADESRWNSALYNPPSSPSTAVGFLSAFGQGVDGALAVGGGQTSTLDTGDTANAGMGNPFTTHELNPDDDYLGNPIARDLTWDTPQPFELQLSSLTISAGATLKVIGKNPLVLRVTGIAQVAGTIDAAGGDGGVGGGAVAAGGAGGPAGFPGGSTRSGSNACTYCPGGCADFVSYLNSCGPAASAWPNSHNGEGPGRGQAGGSVYTYDYTNSLVEMGGTGGGGGSHGVVGTTGEDRKNAGGAPGTGGGCFDTCGVRNSSVIGVRGEPGDTYGDRETADVLFGGSGGGGGGSCNVWGGPKAQAGGGGGGGGGSISIVASGAILVSGGKIDASGGDGGKGAIVTQSQPNNWHSTSGSGGGGAGGLISLISGDAINLTSAVLDASGGAGGERSSVGTSFASSCTACNAGGDGGKGFIFLMDADGQMTGLLPGLPGEYDNFATGILTISEFETSRFSSIAAVTELFPALAANPAYMPLAPADILAHVNPTQSITVLASSAKADPEDPLVPDLASEIGLVEVAVVDYVAGSTVVDITGDLSDLNPGGTPARDAFVRVEARFSYGNGVEAALGPFAYIDRVDLHFSFNG